MRTILLMAMLSGALGLAQEKPNDRRIDYVEFYASDLARTKAFYTTVFGWKFTDYGPAYVGFEDGRIGGGFWKEGKVGRRSADHSICGGSGRDGGEGPRCRREDRKAGVRVPGRAAIPLHRPEWQRAGSMVGEVG